MIRYLNDTFIQSLRVTAVSTRNIIGPLLRYATDGHGV